MREEKTETLNVANLDAFFSQLYEYYLEKGFWCIVVSRVTNLFTVAFTIIFSCFLLVFIDWVALFSCKDDKECSAENLKYLRSNVFDPPTPGEALVGVYFSIFSLYWLWNFASFFHAVVQARDMRVFMNDTLGIGDDQLATVEWCEVLARLVDLQKRVKLCVVRDLSALDITNRIMRKDNFIIAMVNLRCLDITIPWPSLKWVRHRLEDCCDDLRATAADDDNNGDGNRSNINGGGGGGGGGGDTLPDLETGVIGGDDDDDDDITMARSVTGIVRGDGTIGQRVELHDNDAGGGGGGGGGVGVGLGSLNGGNSSNSSSSSSSSKKRMKAEQQARRRAAKEVALSLRRRQQRAKAQRAAAASAAKAASKVRRRKERQQRRSGVHRSAFESDMADAIAAVDEEPWESTSEFKGMQLLGKTLEWNLRFCVVHALFDDQFLVREGFCERMGVKSMRRRFFVMGIINL
jgi:hypothetical protein